MVPRMPNRQYAYFRDDQIVFLMTHEQSSLPDQDLRSWRDALESEEVMQGAKIIWPPRSYTFPALGTDYQPPKTEDPPFTNPFSLLVCDMKDVPEDPLKFLNLVSNLSKPSENGGLLGKELGTLTAWDVSPNWLASSASQAGGTGGPGSWPVPYRGNASRAPYQFRELLSKLSEQGIYGDGANVEVAVLDTAPCPHDLVAAYKECKGWHPLINTLLGPNGKLKLYPATYDQHLRMGSTSLNQHDYKMTDHGLFVAGIIHSIVPQATIHLVEVLSPLGVGDLATLGDGFQKVWQIYQNAIAAGHKIVINCSWMLDMPLVPEHLQALAYTDPEHEFELAVLEMVQQDTKDALALRHQCDVFSALGAQVIAAAGNDRKGNSNGTIPATRFPAAFLGSVGVGAFPKDAAPDPATQKYPTSSYSNVADVPNNVTKIVTLGGEEGEGQGVLGLYLGEFPGCEPMQNCTKWAWWSGTSFATPILTATIAAVLSSPIGLQRTQAALDRLKQPPAQPDQKIMDPNGTDQDESVMEASQVY
jgi:subtilase family protein